MSRRAATRLLPVQPGGVWGRPKGLRINPDLRAPRPDEGCRVGPVGLPRGWGHGCPPAPAGLGAPRQPQLWKHWRQMFICPGLFADRCYSDPRWSL